MRNDKFGLLLMCLLYDTDTDRVMTNSELHFGYIELYSLWAQQCSELKLIP